MGCDSPEVNVGKIYGQKMPKTKERDVRIDTVVSCIMKDQDRFILTRAYDLKLGKERMCFFAPYDPDAAFLAHALTGSKVRYSHVTRPRGVDGDYHIDELHRFEILEGPLQGKVYEFDSWKVDRRKLSKALLDKQRRYDVEVLEGRVSSCTTEGDVLQAVIAKRSADIPLQRGWEGRVRLPDPALLAYAMQGERVRYERFKRRDPVEVARYEHYREKMSPETHHRLALLSGELKGYEFEWGL